MLANANTVLISYTFSPSRMTCLAAICLTQAWMMWKFINFQLKKWREHSQNQASKKKTASPKSRPHKRDAARGESSFPTVYIIHPCGFFLTLILLFPLGLLRPNRRRYQRSLEVRRQNISAGQKGQSLVEPETSGRGRKRTERVKEY